MSERKTFFYGFFKVPNESFADGARSVLLLISRQKEHGVLSRKPDSKLTYSHVADYRGLPRDIVGLPKIGARDQVYRKKLKVTGNTP